MSPRRAAIASAALLVLAAGTASAQPAISRARIFEIAASGVGSPYVWGGGCWDPANRSRLGADCSGYVAKVWQVPGESAVTTCSHPYSTYNFYNERTHWDAVDRSAATRADAFVYREDGAGHIVLWASGDPWGNSEVYEARGTAYGIVHRTRTFSSSYRARRRRAIVADGPPPHPVLTLSVAIDTIEGQARDLCRLSGSDGVFDVLEGQALTERLYVANTGTAVAAAVVVGIEVSAAAFEVRRWEVFDDWEGHSCGAEWCPNDANDNPANPPHAAPGASFVLHLNALSPGETKMIVLDLEALAATFAEGGTPHVRIWVRSVRDFYSKDSFGSSFDNVGGYQTWNGGDLRAASRHTVLGDEVCNGLDDDCDGEADQGLGLGEACTAGRGACEASGLVVCGEAGEAFCDAAPGLPAEEVCGDRVDNDCDGQVDEGCHGGETEPVDPLVPEVPEVPGGSGLTDPGVTGGCACRSAAGGGPGPALLAALVAAAALFGRRRGR